MVARCHGGQVSGVRKDERGIEVLEEFESEPFV